MLFDAREASQAPQLMADLHVVFDTRSGMCQGLHALQKPVFTSLAMKNHLATGGY